MRFKRLAAFGGKNRKSCFIHIRQRMKMVTLPASIINITWDGDGTLWNVYRLADCRINARFANCVSLSKITYKGTRDNLKILGSPNDAIGTDKIKLVCPGS